MDEIKKASPSRGDIAIERLKERGQQALRNLYKKRRLRRGLEAASTAPAKVLVKVIKGTRDMMNKDRRSPRRYYGKGKAR